MKPTPREFGEAARSARLAANVELTAIAEKSKISMRTLDAIEKGEFEKLPSRTFARMFVRQYLQLIGEKPEEAWIDSFDAAWQRFLDGSQKLPVINVTPMRKRRVGPWLMGLALVSLAIVALVYLDGKQRGLGTRELPPTPSVLMPMLAPTASPTLTETMPAVPTSAPKPDPKTVVIRTESMSCWVEIQVEGDKPLSRLLQPSSIWEIPARGRRVNIVLGDGGAAVVAYLGQTHNPAGRPGIVSRLSLGPQTAAP